MQTVKQSHGDKTREKILNAGVKLWPNISLTKIAFETGLTHAAISYHFPLKELRDSVAKHAVTTGVSRVIVQLIADKHPAVANMPVGERHSHFRSV